MNTIKIDKRQCQMIAHRGSSGLERENTNAAFVAAGNRSYFGIETDVHVTSDGKFILFHDDTTERLTSQNFVVEQTGFETLRNLAITDVDGVTERQDIRMPSLEEYISICKKYDKTAVLELKNNMAEKHIREMCHQIEEFDYLDKMIFISFDLDNLLALRRMYPNASIQYLTRKADGDVIKVLKENNFDLDIKYTALTREIIQKLHDEGVKVNCWTVNDKEDAERLIAWGIDFITTNILE